ncbi:hypothetical protein B0A50_08472 [Salinomyces thailandicus]|uniref:Uncharacterized protein n=1 Tax=Salinomyces thailandicus TaxID=706561 RepID=A0A4U0TJV4_9PEZI|nr:hypothetical protein B0A50_08472 [Salinomyces thailandica]
MGPQPPKPLLLCLDAFGTLFTPIRPIAHQYTEVARTLGHTNFTAAQVGEAFKAAYKHEARERPNFGRAVIHKTFQPLVGEGREVHPELAPRLLARFASGEGYELRPGTKRVLRGLREMRRQREVVVGVVTNSDDRVPDVLASLGVEVSPLRYGGGEADATGERQWDVEFTVMSYDVGFEKPDARIFAAAEGMLGLLPRCRGMDLEGWEKVYVGDEYGKDVVGAMNAGWRSILVEAEAEKLPQDVKDIGGREPGDLLGTLNAEGGHVALSSLEKLGMWLGGR